MERSDTDLYQESTRLNAIINNYQIDDSKSVPKINGEISFTPSQPWIMTESIKNNIIFFGEEDEKKYNALIANGDVEACQKALPATFAILDEMVTKGIIHKNKADRQKATLSSKLAKLSK